MTKGRAILLSVIGPATYILLRNLVSPSKPTEKSYIELVSALRNHYQPTISITVQRYKFHTRARKTNESVPDYVSKLKKLAEKCDFKDTLNDMLKDRLVAGINDEKIQKRLLIETDLTFEKAYNISVTEELANQDAHALQTPTGSGPVNKVGCSPKTAPNKASYTHSAHPMSSGAYKQGNKHCFRCGDKSHTAPKCRFINAKCHYCSKVGHIEKVCLSKQKIQQPKKERHEQTNAVEAELNLDEDNSDLFNIQSDSVTPPLHVDVIVDDVQMKFQLDTGAGVSLINQTDFVRHFGNTPLDPASVKLRSYTGNKLTVVGEKLVNVAVGDQSARLPLKVVEGNGPPLFGRDWLQEIRVPWKKIFNVDIVKQPPELDSLLAEYDELFNSELGCLKGVEAHIDIEEGATPQFCKARPLPFAMKKKVEDALQKLESQGVIEKVVHSDWATPVVPVVKAKGDAHLCGDYKVTVNKVAKQDKYPLPLVDEIFASLSHVQETALWSSCAVGLFQRTMENLLKGLPNVSVYIDDVLVTGRHDTEHLSNLRGVLTRLQENGLCLQMTKCQFMLPEVEYLGFKVTKDGINPTESKVRAIKEAPTPTNVNELRTFIGLVNYYARLLPNLAHRMAPLYKLLRNDEAWSWKSEQQSSFQKIKKMMSEDVMLAHYDPDAELVLSCDASSYGIGAVLQQPGPNGELKPVHFASRSLTSAEKNYAQIEREALGIIYGVQKFRQYLLGRTFTLETDHQPLVKLFVEHTAIPQLAAARIKRWALILSAYSYKIKHISSKENACADYLSRAPLQEPPDLSDLPEQEDVLLIDEELLSQLPLTAKTVASETQKDPCLAKVLQSTREGWPSKCDDDKLQPYFSRKTELTVEQGCVLWGSRVVIPSTLRPTLLLDLHSEHTGTVRMKGLARQYFWWPKMNDEIEQIAKNCASCQETASAPPSLPVAKWNWPSGPWKRLHIDYAGPYMGSMFLVVIDSYSKWLEVIPMKSTTTTATIQQLRKVFANLGLPEHIVSDNGPQFSSSEFKEFLMKNNIRHTLTPPGHTASNGMAERYVRYFKSQLKKMEKDEGTLQDKISRILLTYRCTPHPTTTESPAYLLMRRQLRTRFSSLRPSLDSQKDAETFEQNTSCLPKFAVGDKVYVLNLRAGPRWLPGIVIEVLQR
ncbi:uncharacterized protein K02A2.6-like [Actinia tenebrosa]|uniref:Uncharacterized protein K02A2.6-like n=1 Tax=Actinia tenebrosa TaxID=6105 RepID=A0A6P8IXR6_ACTTE|nr:uncharacterized protein K02A2.6-like [Actinia tenebrosa]